METEKLFWGFLDRYAEPIFLKATGAISDGWTKFKINSDLAFTEYLDNAYDKYSQIKTVLYSSHPQYIYNFFEYPTLRVDKEEISSEKTSNILKISHFTIIKGTGGVGKSTVMKHFFLNELVERDKIPVFIELKDLNNCDDDCDFQKFIFSRLTGLGTKFDAQYLEYALRAGCFLFLLDGYDEIITKKKNMFFLKLNDFCDRYGDNYFILSSRPYSDFVEFQRFTVLRLCEFSKEQAISMVKKLDYEETSKENFLNELDENLYEKHTSFASNPLLLTIMLMTYDQYAEIPEKLHLFYSNAFETLYSKHDATKGGYRRELKAGLAKDVFRRVFACFCFITYHSGTVEFSNDELVANLTKARHITNTKFEIENMVDDLTNSICVLYREGLTYRFTHRSFQEYFTAIFLEELSDEKMKKMALALIHSDERRIAMDTVFDMLFDMIEDRFNENVVLPILEEIEQDYTQGDKYDFYYNRFPFELAVWKDYTPDGEEYKLFRAIKLVCPKYQNILTKIAILKIAGDKHNGINIERDDNPIISYLVDKNGKDIDGGEIRCDSRDFTKQDEAYELIRKSWIGRQIRVLSTLKDEILAKKKKSDIDFDGLFSD